MFFNGSMELHVVKIIIILMDSVENIKIVTIHISVYSEPSDQVKEICFKLKDNSIPQARKNPCGTLVNC